MIYYITELLKDKNSQVNAGGKARNDFEKICMKKRYKQINILVNNDNDPGSKKSSKLKKIKELKDEWILKTKHLNEGDKLYIQFPLINSFYMVNNVLNNLKKRKIEIIGMIHDLEFYRAARLYSTFSPRRLKIVYQENLFLKQCDKIILHNNVMKKNLIERGFSSQKILVLEMFDYLLNSSETINEEDCLSIQRKINQPIAIAGNLQKEKAGYVYNLPEDLNFNLYGNGYISDSLNKKNIIYMGSFSPENLAQNISGSFGLVWDGPSSNSCEGIYGQYLKINNPHKLSLYLASELPVIVWEDAAVANFIIENGCGIVIDSLYNLKKRIDDIDESSYNDMIERTKLISTKLKNGEYTKKILNELN